MIFLARLAAIIAICAVPGLASAQATVFQDNQDVPETRLGDLIVEGRSGPDLATTFVRTLAPPIGDGGMARWRQPVCVGITNMAVSPARQMADRISDWAHSFGIQVAAPGCSPDIIVVATADGDTTARELVRARPRQFRIGMSGSDRGASALETFQTSGQPIRWWHVSLPVNASTGRAAGRLPGNKVPELEFSEMKSPGDFGTNAMVGTASRLSTQTRDDLQQVIIVLDLKALDTATFVQVTDYIALVSLAQVDPSGDMRNLPTILNLFDPMAEIEAAMTAWDRAFLQGLYSAEQDRARSQANVSAVVEAMNRAMESPGTR